MINGYKGSISLPKSRRFPFRGELQIFRNSKACAKFKFTLTPGSNGQSGDMCIVFKRYEKSRLRILFNTSLRTSTRLPKAENFLTAFVAPEVVNFLIRIYQTKSRNNKNLLVVHEFSGEHFCDVEDEVFCRMLDLVCNL